MPSEREIEARLRAVHEPAIEPPAPSPAAEAEILLAWAERHAAKQQVERPRWTWLTSHRLAVAFAASFLLLFGACVLPTSYEIPLGLAIEIRGDSTQPLPVDELARYVHQRSAAHRVEVMVRQHAGESGAMQVAMSIRLWDQSLAVGELEPELRERFPALASAEILETALAGELETVWGLRLAHRALHLPPREVDVEQARVALLAQLHAQGVEAHAVVVEIRDHDDGHREIQVEIERE